MEIRIYFLALSTSTWLNIYAVLMMISLSLFLLLLLCLADVCKIPFDCSPRFFGLFPIDKLFFHMFLCRFKGRAVNKNIKDDFEPSRFISHPPHLFIFDRTHKYPNDYVFYFLSIVIWDFAMILIFRLYAVWSAGSIDTREGAHAREVSISDYPTMIKLLTTFMRWIRLKNNKN